MGQSLQTVGTDSTASTKGHSDIDPLFLQMFHMLALVAKGMASEPTLYLRGYSRTTPIMKNGIYTGSHTPRIVPDGCRKLDEPYFAICASKRIELWVVYEDKEEE